MAELDAAVKKEKIIRDDILNLQWLYDTHFREDNSPTREYNLREFLKLIKRAEKQLESIRGVIEAQQIQEEIHFAELVVDSLDSLEELIPSFFFDEKEDPITDFEKYLIPSFFFDEDNEDSIVKLIPPKAVNTVVNEFERKNQILSFHKPLIGECFITILNSSRNLFDPGKFLNLIKRLCYLVGVSEFGFDTVTSCSLALYVCSILMDECDGNSVFELLSKNGYRSSSWSGNSIVCIPINRGVSSTARMMFDKMSESKDVTLSASGVDLFWKLKIGEVFDRGKAFELQEGYSKFDVCLKLFDAYYRKLVQELLYKHGYWSDSNGDGNYFLLQLKLGKVSYKLLLDDYCVFLIFDPVRRMFDCGKRFRLSQEFSYFEGVYELIFKKTTSGLLVLFVCLILMVECHGNSDRKLVLGHGLQLLLMQMGGVEKHKSDVLTIPSEQFKYLLMLFSVPTMVRNCFYFSRISFFLHLLLLIYGVPQIFVILEKAIKVDTLKCDTGLLPISLLGAGNIRCITTKTSCSFVLQRNKIIIENHDTCKLLDRRLQQGKVIWTVSLLQITRETDFRKSQELLDQLHHTGRWGWNGDILSVILQLGCGLLVKLVTHSAVHMKGNMQKLFDKMKGVVWYIHSKVLQYIQMLLLSVFSIVRSLNDGVCFYGRLMRAYTLTKMLSTQVTIALNPELVCLPISEFSQPSPYCCYRLIGLHEFGPCHHSLPCYSSLWGLGYIANVNFSCAEFFVREVVITDVLVKMLIQTIMEVVGPNFKEFKLQQSSKRRDLGVPFPSCNLARDNGRGHGIMQLDIVTNHNLNSAAYTKICYAIAIVISLTVYIFQGKADCKQVNLALVKASKLVVLQVTEKELKLSSRQSAKEGAQSILEPVSQVSDGKL